MTILRPPNGVRARLADLVRGLDVSRAFCSIRLPGRRLLLKSTSFLHMAVLTEMWLTPLRSLKLKELAVVLQLVTDARVEVVLCRLLARSLSAAGAMHAASSQSASDVNVTERPDELWGLEISEDESSHCEPPSQVLVGDSGLAFGLSSVQSGMSPADGMEASSSTKSIIIDIGRTGRAVPFVDKSVAIVCLTIIGASAASMPTTGLVVQENIENILELFRMFGLISSTDDMHCRSHAS